MEQPQAENAGAEEVAKLARLREALSEESLLEFAKEAAADDVMIQRYYSTDEGLTFLDRLDELYRSRAELSGIYRRCRSACDAVAYCSLLVSAILLAGLLRIVDPWPPEVELLWVVSIVQVILAGAIALIVFELKRRRLVTLWERLQLTGEVRLA